MILRTWRGAVRRADLSGYLEHQHDTGIREYRETPGNLGAYVLTRDLTGDRADLVEVTAVSIWASMAAIRAFAGDEPERAVFYPGDDDLLAEKDLHVDHFDISEIDLDPSLSG